MNRLMLGVGIALIALGSLLVVVDLIDKSFDIGSVAGLVAAVAGIGITVVSRRKTH